MEQLVGEKEDGEGVVTLVTSTGKKYPYIVVVVGLFSVVLLAENDFAVVDAVYEVAVPEFAHPAQ